MSSAHDPGALRALVVSDNVHERRLIANLLNSLGAHEVLFAEDSIAALAKINLRRPHLTLIDANMQPISGLSVLRQIRGAAIRGRNDPIALVSSETSPAFVATAEAAGADQVLTKPVSAETLRNGLRLALAKPRPSARAPAKPLADAFAAAAKPAEFDREARTRVLAALDEARAKADSYAAGGDEADMAALRAAIRDASGWTDAVDTLVADSVHAAAQLVAGPAADTDLRLLRAILAAARAVALAPAARSAMREALVGVVREAAQRKSAA